MRMMDKDDLPPFLKIPPRAYGLPLSPPPAPLDVRLLSRGPIVISEAELLGLFVFAAAIGFVAGVWLAS
jgi:hypothetical protein